MGILGIQIIQWCNQTRQIIQTLSHPMLFQINMKQNVIVIILIIVIITIIIYGGNTTPICSIKEAESGSS